MFTKNLLHYFNEGKAGNCPECGGNIKVNIDKTPIRDNYTLCCERCGKFEYFTGETKHK